MVRLHTLPPNIDTESSYTIIRLACMRDAYATFQIVYLGMYFNVYQLTPDDSQHDFDYKGYRRYI